LEIPYRDDDNHVRKGGSRSNLECLDARWGLAKGDLGNGLGGCFPNRYFPLEGGWNLGHVVWCCFLGIPKVVVL
jgi:hypothetical protein